MHIIIAPDSFKDALNSIEAAKAIGRGIKRVMPNSRISYCPVADGGEGTLDVLSQLPQWKVKKAWVKGPLFDDVEAKWLIHQSGSEAFIEMAQASGLQLLIEEKRNPMNTSTFGVGQLIAEALGSGVRKIKLSIGGSATNDAGIGMATALGWKFLSPSGEEMKPIGRNLGLISKIVPPVQPLSASFEVWCDVDNPLFGQYGAAYTYARQKGASEEEVALLDKGLRRFSKVLQGLSSKDFAFEKGAGAAGGLGAGAIAFLNASIVPGIKAMLDTISFSHKLSTSQLIITGEGRIDHQTKYGKAISGICNEARKAGVAVVAFCGSLSASEKDLAELGILAAIQINDGKKPLHEALADTEIDLERTAEDFIVEYFKI